jgi:arylsulfatase A-like enzyme
MINTPEIEYDIYDRKSAEKVRVKWVGEDIHPQIAIPENVNPPPYYPDHVITRQEWARYLNSVSGLDERVGIIMDQLRRDGLDQNTIVFFFADNGRLEARGIHWLWDTGIHVPMILHWPAQLDPPEDYVPGSDNMELISLLDITATTLSIAGIIPNSMMQSRIFLGKHRFPERTYVFSARDRIDETVIRHRSVRDKKYHYIRNYTPGSGFLTLNRYKEKCFLVKPLMRDLKDKGLLSGAPLQLMNPQPYEMLYDTESDPFEIQNIAESEQQEHKEALLRLRAALDTWIIETGDQGVWPEKEAIVKPFEKEMHDWFGTPEWYTD